MATTLTISTPVSTTLTIDGTTTTYNISGTETTLEISSTIASQLAAVGKYTPKHAETIHSIVLFELPWCHGGMCQGTMVPNPLMMPWYHGAKSSVSGAA